MLFMRRLVTFFTQSPHSAGTTAGILIAIALGAYSFSEGEAYRSAAYEGAQSRRLLARTQELLSGITQAESGERGYLLTGDPSYLAPYHRALSKIARARAEVQLLAPARTADLRQFLAVIDAMLDEMARTIRVRESGDAVAALAIVQTHRGKEAMDQVEALAGKLIEQENTLLARLEDEAARHGYKSRTVVIIGALCMALLLWFTNKRVNRLLRTQDRLITDLAGSRELESRGRAALATTLRSIGDAVISTDAAGRVQFLNPVAETLTGWSNAAADGRALTEVFRIIDEGSRQPVEDPAVRVLRERQAVGLANHTLLVARDGREIPIDDSGAPIHDETGAIAGVVLVFRDVTSRRRAQRVLEDSERRYRLLFETNPSPMWVYDRDDLAFLAVNEAAVKHYGYSREEFLSMTLRDIRPPEDVAALLADVAKPWRQLHTDGPWRHRKKDGSIIFVEITSHALPFDSANACLVLAQDVTQRLKLEEDLRQSQKLEAVGQLAGGIAHDFNNLLTVVEGYAELVHGDLSEDDPNRESVKEILVAAQRAASLTRQLLAFSRRQMLQPVRLSLNANVTSTQRMLSRVLGENITITTTLEPNLWDVYADPGQIDQIILNLSVNARDAMEHGGRLTVSTANIEIPQGFFSEIPPGRYARLVIADTGHGMDEATCKRIFEPFFTTKEVGRGTGLGLSTVYGIVKQSGGHITVDSEPGQGSTFSILLPAVGGPAASTTARPAEAPVEDPAEETVLVVEDDDVVRHLVGTMLRSAGYRVIAPPTTEEALSVCSRREARIDLLVTDMVLPGTDGVTVAEAAKQVRPDIKVLYMSGYTEHAVLRRSPMDSGVPFLQKPFTKSALIAMVRQALSDDPNPTDRPRPS
jgi:PAS domain S-box-containing protein